MRAGKLRGQAFRFNPPVARHVIRDWINCSVTSYVPLRRKNKKITRFHKTSSLEIFPETRDAEKKLPARTRVDDVSMKGNDVHTPLRMYRKTISDRVNYNRADGRVLSKKNSQHSVSSSVRQSEKLTSESVVSFFHRERAPSFSKAAMLGFNAFLPKKNEADGAAHSFIVGKVERDIFPIARKGSPRWQGSYVIRAGVWESNVSGGTKNRLQDNLVPSAVLRKKLSESMSSDRKRHQQIAKEEFSSDGLKRLSSKSHSEIFEKHDLERSSRISARQGHGGVDELRFPQYPGRSIGMS